MSEMDFWSSEKLMEERARIVNRALRILTAGGLKPPFDSDASDMIEVWTAALEEFDPSSITRAATKWSTGSDHFPTLSEFIDQIRSDDRVLRSTPTEVCPECLDEWEGFQRDADGFLSPCPACRPLQYERWANGCFGPSYTHNRTSCRHCIEEDEALRHPRKKKAKR
jgi:hypothetical protein